MKHLERKHRYRQNKLFQERASTFAQKSNTLEEEELALALEDK